MITHFTSEVKVNNLFFWDSRLDHNTFNVSVHRHPTFTGLCLNYLSFLLVMFKVIAIRTFLYIYFHICSEWHSIHRELQALEIFLKNEFH